MTPPRSDKPLDHADTKQALVVLHLDPPYRSTELVKILLAEAAERHWHLRDLVLSKGLLPRNHAPAGALLTVLPSDPLCAMLRALDCPMVRLGRLEHPDDNAVPAILPDYAEAGRRVAEYFARRGFRDLALVAHASQVMMDQLHQGLQQHARTLGCTCHVFRFTNAPPASVSDRTKGLDERSRQLTAFLQSLPKPVALLSGTDFVAAQICLLCEDIGLSVPEDIAVMAWGNAASTYEMTPVPIISIGIDGPEMMRIAIRRLDDLIHHKPVPAHTFVPPAPIATRRSTDILAVDDPLVARAIRFIWDHLDEDLSVADVARRMQTPRYRLERAFRVSLKRGIAAELRRIRIERFCQLLRTTDLPISQLAPRVGFNSSQYLHNVFRNAFGLSPRQYRLQHRSPQPEG